MNETIKALHARKSIRVYTDREIAPQDKRAILEAAAAAPSAGNMQMYTILDINNQTVKNELAVTCDNQPFIAKGKMVLIFCADYRKWYDVFLAGGCKPRTPGVGDLLLAVDDALIAAQNAVVAAESLGIGSCYIGDIMERCERHRALLNLPQYVFPAAMLVFGYPTEQQQARKKPPRSDLYHIVHEDAYRRMDELELRAMLEDRTDGQDFEDWIVAFCKRKYNSDFSREMSRSVAKYLEDFAGPGD